MDTLTNKKLVTNHDAFGYYVDRYGLEFVGSTIPSFDTSAELSASDIQDLVAKIKAQGVKAVFSESSQRFSCERGPRMTDEGTPRIEPDGSSRGLRSTIREPS